MTMSLAVEQAAQNTTGKKQLGMLPQKTKSKINKLISVAVDSFALALRQLPTILADNIKIGDPEVSASQLNKRMDVQAAQMRKELADLRVIHCIWFNYHATVESTETHDVTVALKQLHNPMCNRVIMVEASTEAVGNWRQSAGV